MTKKKPKTKNLSLPSVLYLSTKKFSSIFPQKPFFTHISNRFLPIKTK